MLISHFCPNSFMRRFTDYADGHKFLLNCCTKDADLIYCGSISQLDKALVAKEQYGKSLICWVWDLPYCWPEWVRNNDEVRMNLWRDKFIAKAVFGLLKCDKVISSSKYTQRILKEKFNIASEQVYFYIDTEELDAIPVSYRKGHIIQISRFALNKRFNISIKAMSGLGRKLVCVGTGNHNNLRRLAESLSADVDFHCNIERSKTIALLKEADILISPSIFEGWGITPIEALYCGTPVLLSDLEVFKEVYGDNVPYHKRDDPDDMKDKLRCLLADRQLQNKITKRCRPLISEFTIPKFIKRWEKAIV